MHFKFHIIWKSKDCHALQLFYFIVQIQRQCNTNYSKLIPDKFTPPYHAYAWALDQGEVVDYTI